MARFRDEGSMGKIVWRLGKRSRIPGRQADPASVPIPEHLKWLIWRLVIERVATLTELERYYDLVDVLDANEALDLREEAERRANEPLERAMKGRGRL